MIYYFGSKTIRPTENNFKSRTYTKNKIKTFQNNLLRVEHYLVVAVYIHSHATELAIKHFPGEIVVGNVQMTMNSPEYLLQSKKECLEITKNLSKKYKNRYAVTPRFAITTHPDVMNKSAQFAKNNSFIQTHLSETKERFRQLWIFMRGMPGFEKLKATQRSMRNQVFLEKTIMGHGIHLSPSELSMLKKTKTPRSLSHI